MRSCDSGRNKTPKRHTPPPRSLLAAHGYSGHTLVKLGADLLLHAEPKFRTKLRQGEAGEGLALRQGGEARMAKEMWGGENVESVDWFVCAKNTISAVNNVTKKRIHTQVYVHICV